MQKWPLFFFLGIRNFRQNAIQRKVTIFLKIPVLGISSVFLHPARTPVQAKPACTGRMPPASYTPLPRGDGAWGSSTPFCLAGGPRVPCFPSLSGPRGLRVYVFLAFPFRFHTSPLWLAGESHPQCASSSLLDPLFLLFLNLWASLFLSRHLITSVLICLASPFFGPPPQSASHPFFGIPQLRLFSLFFCGEGGAPLQCCGSSNYFPCKHLTSPYLERGGNCPSADPDPSVLTQYSNCQNPRRHAYKTHHITGDS